MSQQNNQPLKFKRFRFENLPNLSPVTLYIEQASDNSGSVCLHCRGRSWVRNFTDPGCDLILHLADSPWRYMVDELTGFEYVSSHMRKEFLGSIWAAVQPVLRDYCETTTAQNRWDTTYPS